MLLVVVWSPEVFLLARLTSAPASLAVLRWRRGRTPGVVGRSSLVSVAVAEPGRLLLLLLLLLVVVMRHPGISLRLLLVSKAATARLGKPLRSCELLLLQQEVGGRRGKERNSLLESWRELGPGSEGRGTAKGILRHSWY